MKLHLPLPLRRSLVALLTAVSAAPAWAAMLSSDVDLQVYADFGQNCGRYSVSNVNDLLNHLNKNGSDVKIYYADGTYSAPLEHGMISFESRQETNGAGAGIHYNFVATVAHNGVQNPSFSSIELGADQAIKYKGIEYRIPSVWKDDGSRDGQFIHSANWDFKVTRLSKIVTDVTTSQFYSNMDTLKSGGLAGELLYHTGAGYSSVYNPETGVVTAINTIHAGGVQQIKTQSCNSSGYIRLDYDPKDWDLSTSPLPYGVVNKDSGSSDWVWDETAGEYRYIAAVQAFLTQTWGYSGSNIENALDAINSYDKTVSSSSSVINLSITRDSGESVSETDVRFDYKYTAEEISTTLWKGQATANGTTLAEFTGVKHGVSTWNDMVGIRDEDNWYALTDSCLNAAPHNVSEAQGKGLDYADLFMTDNLVFKATADCSEYNIVLEGDLDLGIGYTEFKPGDNLQNPVKFTISGNGYLDSAGYIIDDGVDVYLTLSSTDKTREVRKIGDGSLHIVGSGDNDIMLNLGGKGKTTLNQSGGYAAYNVLANNGATVVLEGGDGVSQIKRDFTFGNGGGTLDFHGHSWTEGAEGNFSMKALTQDAVISNYKENSSSEITFTAGGTYLGSFLDDKSTNSSLKVNYAGDGTWTLNSIHTKLQHADSGLAVNGGTVKLNGTLTQHAASNEIGTERPWQKGNDWHYADAQMNVTVAEGATFELGSHARLTGNVEVKGTYIMREGVHNRYEYIEGGYTLEDTYVISSFYGHKGNTVLDGGVLQVEFSEGTTSNLTYACNISGSGNMTVDTADGSFTLTGNNTFSGTKELLHGHLIADDVTALGSGAGWQLAEGTTMTVHAGMTAENLLSVVDGSSSSGLLVLGNSIESAVDLSESNLILGAMAGKTVQYGAETETVRNPRLGGGGGTLEVLAKVEADNLVLGRDGETGVVRLLNSNNSLTGTISMNGQVALDATCEAIGNAQVNLDYGNGMMLRGALSSVAGNIKSGSRGALLLDYYNGNTIDMSGMGEISLSALTSATINGITVGGGESYHLGGYSGTLNLGKNAISGSNSMLVDAKGNVGGKVELAAQDAYTGAVTVQDTSDGKTGSVSLGFSENDALIKAASVTVNQGGVLDVGDTSQILNNLQVNAGGLLTGGEGSTLVFNMSSEKFQYGSMQLDHAEKTGSANLVLVSSDNEWNLFTVKQGTLFTRVDNSLSATGITRVESGATLNLNTWNGDGFRSRRMHGVIQLADGANMTTGTGNYEVTLTGSFAVDAGGRANMTGGKWILTGSSFNQDGGTIAFASSELHMSSTSAQRIGGTFSVETDTLFYSSEGATDMLKQFDHLNIAAGKTLTLDENHWNTIWRVDSLTGSGNLLWNADTNHSTTARVIIGGNGEYSGNISFNRRYDNPNRTHQAYLEISGNKAVSGAVINLDGHSATSVASLAVNASNAQVKGLNGNTHSHLLAGPSPTDAASTSNPASTGRGTLVITGSGTYSFGGTLGHDNDTVEKSLSLEMNGSGTQTFNGSKAVLNNVAALQGTLNVTTSSLNIMGNLGIGKDATLNLGSYCYSLDSGKSLTISGTGATLHAGLNLNGGTLVFDAAALDQTGFALEGELSVASGAVINFSGLTTALDGKSFTLTTSDWSGALNTLSSADLIFMRADFTTNASGNLVVTFARNGYLWNGTESAWSWTTSSFSTDTSAPNENSNVVFSDVAANTTVNVDGYVSASSIHFENKGKDYLLSDAGGSQIKTDTIVQTGSGKTTVAPWTVIKSGIDVQSGTLVLEDADFDGSNAVISVGTGKLSLKLGEKETVSSLVLKDGADFKLSGNRVLTVSNGVQKNIEGTVQMSAYGSSSITDNKSDYAVNGGSLHIGNEEAAGSVILKSVSLKNGGELHVEGGYLGLENGIAAGAGQSSVRIEGGKLVLSKDYIISGTTDDGKLDINIRNGALHSAGISTRSANIKLQDGGVLASSDYETLISQYACDIELSGNATVSDSMYRLMNSKVSATASVGNIELSGRISSAGDADLHLDVSQGGRVVISGEAAVSGDVTVAASGYLGVADKLTVKDWVGSQSSGVQVSSLNGRDNASLSGGSKLAWADDTAFIHGTGTTRTQMNNTLAELYDGATLSLNNVMLCSDSQIKTVEGDADATIHASNVGLQVIESGSLMSLDSAQTLTLSGMDKTYYTLESGSKVLEITTNLLAGNLTLTGESLMVNFVGYDVELYDAVQLNFESGVTVDTNMVITAQAQVEQGTAPQLMTGSYVSNGNVGTIVFIMNYHIPEPTTATLSLLALAGMAARRRRSA